MVRNLRRNKPTSSSGKQLSETPPIAADKADGKSLSPPCHTAASEDVEPSRPRPTSKAGIMLALLEAPDGATLAKLMQVTGWQAHTIRAALSGLRKRGFSVGIAKLPGADGETVSTYRIAAPEDH